MLSRQLKPINVVQKDKILSKGNTMYVKNKHLSAKNKKVMLWEETTIQRPQ